MAQARMVVVVGNREGCELIHLQQHHEQSGFSPQEFWGSAIGVHMAMCRLSCNSYALP